MMTSVPVPQDRGGGVADERRRREPDIEDKVKVAKTPYELMRMRLEYLTEHIEKPAPIPGPPKEKAPPKPLEFVRNVVGSSAGAGSAEYHIYRNNRKKEMNRLEHLEKMSEKERLAKEFEERKEQHKQEAEEKTAKKRAKRLKAKERMKRRRKEGKKNESDDSDSDEDDDSNEEQSTNAQPDKSQSKRKSSDAQPADKTVPKS